MPKSLKLKTEHAKCWQGHEVMENECSLLGNSCLQYLLRAENVQTL